MIPGLLSSRQLYPFISPSLNLFCGKYRSEEHTSELQSRRDLVCRLLLEKKKAAIIRNQFFVVTANYVFQLDVTSWVLLHLLLGVVIGIAGFFVIRGALCARCVVIVFAAV